MEAVRGPARRVAGIGTSIFTEITGAGGASTARSTWARGSRTSPRPTSSRRRRARHIREDRNQYAASPGVPRLRAALADDWRRRLHRTARPVDPDAEITVG